MTQAIPHHHFLFGLVPISFLGGGVGGGGDEKSTLCLLVIMMKYMQGPFTQVMRKELLLYKTK